MGVYTPGGNNGSLSGSEAGGWVGSAGGGVGAGVSTAGGAGVGSTSPAADGAADGWLSVGWGVPLSAGWPEGLGLLLGRVVAATPGGKIGSPTVGLADGLGEPEGS